MEIHTGDEVLVKHENQMSKIFNLKHAVKEAQAIVAKYNPHKLSLSQSLIAARRKEVQRQSSLANQSRFDHDAWFAAADHQDWV